MEIKSNFDKAVYVRPVEVSQLPEDVQSELGGVETVYGIYDDEGTQLALVNGQQLAFTVARHNDYQPFSLN